MLVCSVLESDRPYRKGWLLDCFKPAQDAVSCVSEALGWTVAALRLSSQQLGEVLQSSVPMPAQACGHHPYFFLQTVRGLHPIPWWPVLP